ncbi:hypothetical protein E2562_009181 [Oryza meyeriana var. granulata]|uniref:Uncharacterized protein n=1 Tax=Oryza meyeriana var. granulata TaxID=110450 RepID=A0A6G1CFZ0_9ORYZ|nr:hypothetical protein E2562_009181 [Oryza meyeriana var. granulata]
MSPSKLHRRSASSCYASLAAPPHVELASPRHLVLHYRRLCLPVRPEPLAYATASAAARQAAAVLLRFHQHRCPASSAPACRLPLLCSATFTGKPSPLSPLWPKPAASESLPWTSSPASLCRIRLPPPLPVVIVAVSAI